MIVKISKRGDDPGGLIRYLAGPGKANEHTLPHVVAGSITYPGTMDPAMQKQVAGDLRAYSQLWPDTTINGGKIWHTTLSLSADEGPLTDARWAALATDYMTQMGLHGGTKSPIRWVAVEHGLSTNGNPHVHIVANLCREDGTKASVWQDMPRSQRIATKLEVTHGLKLLPSRHTNVSSIPYSQSDSNTSKKTGDEPTRIKLERKVRAAAAQATDLPGFTQLLEKDGLTVKPFIKEGEIRGYSIQEPGQKYTWAGGKLARDLSFPRLQQGWVDKTTNQPSHLKAVDELVTLQHNMPVATPEELADTAHQVAGALAVVSQTTEDPPGDLARASRTAGTYAQTRTYVWKPKPPALSIGLLFVQCLDPEGPVGKTVMLKQLMATYRALLDAQYAQRARATTRTGVPSMSDAPEEELVQIGVTAGVTTGAMVMERHARKKEAKANSEKPAWEPWDAKSIRKARIENDWVQATQRAAHRPVPGRMTQEQYDRITELAKVYELPAMVVGIDRYTEQEAADYIASLEQHAEGLSAPVAASLPKTALQESDEVEQFMSGLETKHGAKIDARIKPNLQDPATWATGDGPSTDAQRKWLVSKGGLTPEEAAKMTKAGASSYRTQREQQGAQAVALTPSVAVKNIPVQQRRR